MFYTCVSFQSITILLAGNIKRGNSNVLYNDVNYLVLFLEDLMVFTFTFMFILYFCLHLSLYSSNNQPIIIIKKKL